MKELTRGATAPESESICSSQEKKIKAGITFYWGWYLLGNKSKSTFYSHTTVTAQTGVSISTLRDSLLYKAPVKHKIAQLCHVIDFRPPANCS